MGTTTERRRRAHVVLSDALIRAVDGQVGQRRRSRFIEEAVEEKLRRLRRVEALERAVEWSREGGVPKWGTSDGTTEWVRSLRREWDGRLDTTKDGAA
jgi:hypothetical protein